MYDTYLSGKKTFKGFKDLGNSYIVIVQYQCILVRFLGKKVYLNKNSLAIKMF